jgi:hypothetical protein
MRRLHILGAGGQMVDGATQGGGAQKFDESGLAALNSLCELVEGFCIANRLT